MDLVSGIATGVVTLVVLVTAGVAVGFAVLFRRRGDRGIRRASGSSTTSIEGLRKRAGSLLVRLDDALRDADDELGYALAQFGPHQTRPYADAVAEARAKVAEAFRLTQALDDAHPDTDREQREWTLQVIALCEQAEAGLAAQNTAFGALRRLEVNAAGTLTDVRSRITASTARAAEARAVITTLATEYSPGTLTGVADNPAAAEELLTTATRAADAAESGISQTGVSAVSGTLQEAGQATHRADQLLDAVDRTARDLRAASDALAVLRATTKKDLVEARAERDKAPDADTGQAIIQAMTLVESALAPQPGPADPVADLDRVGEAVAQLDLALASARNQTQRLAHARAAYEGTLVSATSQIAAAHQYIGSRGGGASARTRLAEAERQLMLAQAETDPVEALDAIRRAVTHARDADALARYDTMGGR